MWGPFKADCTVHVFLIVEACLISSHNGLWWIAVSFGINIQYPYCYKYAKCMIIIKLSKLENKYSIITKERNTAMGVRNWENGIRKLWKVFCYTFVENFTTLKSKSEFSLLSFITQNIHRQNTFSFGYDKFAKLVHQINIYKTMKNYVIMLLFYSLIFNCLKKRGLSKKNLSAFSMNKITKLMRKL